MRFCAVRDLLRCGIDNTVFDVILGGFCRLAVGFSVEVLFFMLTSLNEWYLCTLEFSIREPS